MNRLRFPLSIARSSERSAGVGAPLPDLRRFPRRAALPPSSRSGACRTCRGDRPDVRFRVVRRDHGSGESGSLLGTIPLRSLLKRCERTILFDRLFLQGRFPGSILVISALVLAILGVVSHRSVEYEGTKRGIPVSSDEAADPGDIRKEESNG